MTSNNPVEGRLDDHPPLVDAETAMAEVRAEATVLVSGFGSVGYPKAIPIALADSGRDLSLTVVSGGSVGEEIDERLHGADAIARRFPYQSRRPLRESINAGAVAFHDRDVSVVGDEVRYGGLVEPDVAIVEAIAVGQDWLIPSTSIGQTPAFVEAADRLLVEVNRAQPLSLQSVHDVYRTGPPPGRKPIPLTDPGGRIGGPKITFDPDKLVGVVETDRPDTPYSFRDPTEGDRRIAEHFGRFLERELPRSTAFEDSVRLQFGVGSLGNALMGELAEVDMGGRELIYYGEVIQDGLLDLLEAGQLGVASATSLALSSEGQERLFADVDRYADSVVLRPADVSNSPAVIRRFGVVAVNSALEIDLYGHVNSTHVGGTGLLNGVGGSGDFNRNALIAVCALPSVLKGGEVSRIVPMTPHVDHTEHDIDVVVTEQGVADLRGLAPTERAELLIERCAHPDFRPALRAYLDRAREAGGHLHHDLDSVWSWAEDGGG